MNLLIKKVAVSKQTEILNLDAIILRDYTPLNAPNELKVRQGDLIKVIFNSNFFSN